MISVVCVYKNKEILDKYLLRSLKNQTVDYELILLNNIQGKFNSASKALNLGGKKSKGKYIMFVHNDVMLSSDLWLEKVEKILDKLPNFGIAGVAGKKNNRGVMTIIKHGNPAKYAGSITIKKSEKVQTLDECLVIIPRQIFKILQFDEKVCNDWHLFAVDYCLSAERLGFDSYVIPMFIYHRSAGYSMSEKYFVTLEKVLKKHKKHYNQIYTTMGNWSTRYPVSIKRIYLWTRRRVGILLRNMKIKNDIKS